MKTLNLVMMFALAASTSSALPSRARTTFSQPSFFAPNNRNARDSQPQPQPQPQPPPSPYKPQPSYDEPASYAFEWRVQDDYSRNDFGHQENREDKLTTGSYYVALPDGRTQKVTYTVDGYGGYQAEVTYEGEAQYPDEPPKSYPKPSPPAYPAPAPPAPAPSYPSPAPPAPAPTYPSAPAPSYSSYQQSQPSVRRYSFRPVEEAPEPVEDQTPSESQSYEAAEPAAAAAPAEQPQTYEAAEEPAPVEEQPAETYQTSETRVDEAPAEEPETKEAEEVAPNGYKPYEVYYKYF